jgi:hypothetical protein
MFPKNSIEAETLGYFNNISQKQNVTPVFGSIIKNTRISNMYKKLSIDNSINKNYNKLKNNTTSMLTKKYKFLINNKISEKKTKKIFIKKNNKFSNKLLIKLSTNYSCRKISEKKQNMLNNISERGQTLNKIRSFNRSLNKNSINYIKKNNLLTKLIFNLMFYSKSRVVLKKNIKFANVELVRFRFNLNLIRFNQLITNILLRNVTKTILSNSFFIKKNILISNTKESLSNKINKSTLYDFKLFGDNKKIINKKKKYSILSKRKDLQNAKLTVNGSFINNNLYKNKYKEILKKLEKFGSI